MTTTLPSHITHLGELDEAWRTPTPGVRLEAVRAGARKLKERLHAGRPARSVRTYDLITLPYPTRYGLGDANRSLYPYLLMRNRMQVVTFETEGGVKRLLVNPSDHERNEATPFFKRLASGMPDFVNRLVARRHSTVPERLREAGLVPEQIDYVTYDHLHTQDVRRVLDEWCPRAKLLVHVDELAVFARLHPLQRDWYVADGVSGVAPERIVPFDRDLLLGDGVALVRTPGHTEGNHSIVLHTAHGVWAISENGVCADNYSPERSDVAGLAAHARATGVEVILNANTRERSLDQYTSMILEKTLVDATPEGWPQVFNSSEMIVSPLLPGLHPTFAHRAIAHGPEPA
jgi:glyoxylase-like metal-dependent hydrolase (beta-lactamase superfamily II)